MGQIWEFIKIALMNIRSNKGRSILTMLGIIIGISSVILLKSLSHPVNCIPSCTGSSGALAAQP